MAVSLSIRPGRPRTTFADRGTGRQPDHGQAVPRRGESHSVVAEIGDPVDRDGWTSERVGTIERLLPHLRHFVAVRHALLESGALGASLLDLLDNVRAGVVRLDRRGRVVAANDRALALLRRGDGLRDEGGRLRAALPGEDAALQRLIARALPSRDGPGVGGSMPLGRPEARSRLVVHVSPVHGEGVESGPGGVGALVLVVDPAERAPVDPERVPGASRAMPLRSCAARPAAYQVTIAPRRIAYSVSPYAAVCSRRAAWRPRRRPGTVRRAGSIRQPIVYSRPPSNRSTLAYIACPGDAWRIDAASPTPVPAPPSPPSRTKLPPSDAARLRRCPSRKTREPSSASRMRSAGRMLTIVDMGIRGAAFQCVPQHRCRRPHALPEGLLAVSESGAISCGGWMPLR